MKAAVLLGLEFLAAAVSRRNYLRLPALHDAVPVLNEVLVSIIVPARDEAERLPALLRSLLALNYSPVEIIVVDDESSDATAVVARSFGVRVVEGTPRPLDWSGKCWACWQGAATASGAWLLFTDADTVHRPDSLGSALALSHARAAGLCSLLARQRCETFWERLLVPYAYAMYFVGARRVNQSGGAAIANGQYMLFRRETYERIGGHGAVRGSVIEDVALARLAMRHREGVVLARSGGAVDVRMYTGLQSIWEGFGKNAARFIAVSPRFGLPAAVATGLFAGSVVEIARTSSRPARLALFAAPCLCLLPWQREADVPLGYALLHPLASAVFQVLALDSVRRWATGRTMWKGRRY